MKIQQIHTGNKDRIDRYRFNKNFFKKVLTNADRAAIM